MRKHPRPIPKPPLADAPEAALSTHAFQQMKDVQAELAGRRLEALRLYEPMPKQEEFHRCLASERLVIGGNRCLAGDQLIYDPYDCEYHKVSEIGGWFHVESLKRGGVAISQAKRPFVKGWDDLYAFRLSNGGEIRCTLNHLVLSGDGRWAPVGELLLPEFAASLPRSTSGIYLQESPEGDLRLSRTPGGSLGGYPLDRRSCDERLQLAATAVQESVRRPADAPERSRCCCSQDGLGHAPRCSPPCPQPGRPSTPGVQIRSLAPGGACEIQIACTPCSPPSRCAPEARLSGSLFCAQPHTKSASAPPASRSCCACPSGSPVGGNEHVYITSYEYLGQGEVWDFEVIGTHNYLIAGVPNHNSGKSAATFVEDARAATGQDPYDKYPKEGGNLVIIGKNWPHVGMVIYPMLFKAGAFRIIRDEVTGQWRAFRPVEDAARKKDSKPAPPLIPPRMIKDMSWVLKNASYLNKAELVNGWTIYCFSSEGEPPQGFQADLVHIDEDVNNERWIGEMQARLADRKGRFVWSAMPHSKNDALLGLSERADQAAERGDESPTIKKFTLRFLDNPHIDQEEKRKNIERWSALGQEELRMRAEGEFTTESTLMYPTFNPSVHMLPRAELMAIPDDWTRYVAIDPGHAVMATLFGAVPPDEKFLLIYDELYIRNCNALIWGEQFAEKAGAQSIYAAIMDMHGGTLRDLGSGRLPHELYTEELRKRGIKFLATGHSFIPGSDDIPARTSLVRQMMHIRGDGTTRLKIWEGGCPNLIREIKRYRKKTTNVNGVTYVTDQPQTRGEVHAAQCFDDKTEVLTENGWKLFADVVDAEKVATVNLGSNELEYQHFTQRIEKDHCGEMVRIRGARVSAHVTPDHRMVCLDRDGQYRIREAGDLCITDRMTNSFLWRGEERTGPVLLDAAKNGKKEFQKELDPYVWAEFMGWFLSEGYVDKTPRCPGSGYRVVICQKKQTSREHLGEFLKKLPYRWVETPVGYQTSSKQLWQSLIGFGGTFQKYVPDWILRSHSEILRAFLRGAVMGDGWTDKQTGHMRYGSASKRLADGVQEVMLKLGMSPAMHTEAAHAIAIRGKPGVAQEFYRVSQCKQRPISMRDGAGTPHFEPSHYEGKVYCLSVPNTTLVVRRDGMPIIAGNCLEYLCSYEPRYHAPPKQKGPDPWWVKWRADRLRRQRTEEDPCVLLAPTGKLNR